MDMKLPRQYLLYHDVETGVTMKENHEREWRMETTKQRDIASKLLRKCPSRVRVSMLRALRSERVI